MHIAIPAVRSRLTLDLPYAPDRYVVRVGGVVATAEVRVEMVDDGSGSRLRVTVGGIEVVGDVEVIENAKTDIPVHPWFTPAPRRTPYLVPSIPCHSPGLGWPHPESDGHYKIGLPDPARRVTCDVPGETDLP